MKLRELAHSRTGDKGDTSNISVIAYEASNYERIRKAVTAERVAQYMGRLFPDGEVPENFRVHRYELPGVHALNFVVRGALRGGVTRSLALDAHGKTLGSILLDLDI